MSENDQLGGASLTGTSYHMLSYSNCQVSHYKVLPLYKALLHSLCKATARRAVLLAIPA